VHESQLNLEFPFRSVSVFSGQGVILFLKLVVLIGFGGCLCGEPLTANYSKSSKKPTNRPTFEAAPQDDWHNPETIASIRNNTLNNVVQQIPTILTQLALTQLLSQAIILNQITQLMSSFFNQMSSLLEAATNNNIHQI
ncbi:hypothetical protein AVEN_148724-1, partial [Araneus ventricosus]